jgi:hypothetical protein
MLADADPTARHRAAVAIGHIGGPAGAAALREAIEKGAFSSDLRASLEAIRALGHLKDVAALDLLAGLLPEADTEETDKQGRARRKRWGDVSAYHRAAAAAEALGRIGAAVPGARPKIEQTLLAAYRRLGGYSTYCGAYGDHSALHACHASPMHHRIAEALDAMGSTAAGPIAGLLLQAMPTDPDRGLLAEADAVERITGRVLARSGRADEIIETCLAVLGDPDAKAAQDLGPAVTKSPDAWAGNPVGEPRAAQILAAVCLDGRYGPRVLAALKRYAEQPPSAIDGRLASPGRIPATHWVSFYLARTLGRLRFAGAAEFLAEAVGKGLPEAALGRPDAPGVPLLYIHKTMTPCWRAAAADALGRIGDRRAASALVAAVKDLENASDVRAAAAGALARLAGPPEAEVLAALAADYPEVSTRRLLQAAAGLAAARQAAE